MLQQLVIVTLLLFWMMMMFGRGNGGCGRGDDGCRGGVVVIFSSLSYISDCAKRLMH